MYEIKIDRVLSMVAMVLAFGLLLGSASQAQLQPTTNVVVTDSLNCDGNINLNAARFRSGIRKTAYTFPPDRTPPVRTKAKKLAG